VEGVPQPHSEASGGPVVTAADDERRSRYEEGKSADPTENMSDADAKEWKSNTEEHGDKFKKDAAEGLFKSMEEEASFELSHAIKALKVVMQGASNPRRTKMMFMSALAKLARVTTVLGQDPAIGEAITRAHDILFRKWRNTAAFDQHTPSTMYEPPAARTGSQSDGGTKGASSEEQWEMANDIINQGESHPAFKAIKAGWDEGVKAIAEAKRRSESMKRVGAGRTEDPTFVTTGITPALKEYAEEVLTIANQMNKRLGGPRLAAEDDKRSRYEEGKPADPTENMSDADAKEWKSNTEEHKDKFKSASWKVDARDGASESWKAA